MSVFTWMTAHPSREKHVARMLDEMEWPEERFRISWDTSGAGVWPHTRNALQRGFMDHGADHDHLMILQDDLYLCRDFIAGVEEAVSHLPPEAPACFYANRDCILDALTEGATWCVIPDGLWGPAAVLPMKLIPDFLEWEAENVRMETPNYDSRLGLWAIATGRWGWCSVPSLAEHACPADSLVGHVPGGRHQRVATAWLGRNVSPLELDWEAGATQPYVDDTTRWMQYKWEYSVVRASGRKPWTYAEEFG